MERRPISPSKGDKGEELERNLFKSTTMVIESVELGLTEDQAELISRKITEAIIEGLSSEKPLADIISQRFSDLEQAFQAVVNPEIADVKAWLKLAELYTEVGRIDDAKSAFETAIKYQPDSAEAWTNLGSLYAIQLHYKDTELAYLNALKSNPKYADAWAYLGNLFEIQKRKTNAKEAWEKALAFAPANWPHRERIRKKLGNLDIDSAPDEAFFTESPSAETSIWTEIIAAVRTWPGTLAIALFVIMTVFLTLTIVTSDRIFYATMFLIVLIGFMTFGMLYVRVTMRD